MAPSRDDDLDWLYGRDRKPAAPDDERTRAAGTQQGRPREAGPRTRSQSARPTEGYPGPQSPDRPQGTRQPDRPEGTRQYAAPQRDRTPSGGRPAKSPFARLRSRRPGDAHRVRRILRIVIVAAVLWLVFVIVTPFIAWGQTTKVDAAPAGARPGNSVGTTYLLVGSDSREGLSEEERKRLGTGDAEGQRTDTIMLLYVPLTGKPALISIPRDSFVSIPGHGKNKINAAYAFGGPKLLVQTVEQATGLRVDGYVEIGFGGFVGVIDALNGIEMCPPKAIKDHNAHLNIPAGCQNMDGTTALGYVRMRYSDPTGDLGRMNRQRQMIGGVVKKAASPLTLILPWRWWNLNMGAARSLHVGQDTNVAEVAGLAIPMMRVSKGDAYTLMVPVSNPNASSSVGSVMVWDTKASKEMFTEISRGDTSKLQRFAQ